MSRFLRVGINDLRTTDPDVAAQAHNWDPTTVLRRSTTKQEWICEKGHIWITRVTSRVGNFARGCPYCDTQSPAVWPGFNDLATISPHIAGMAHGWDASTVTAHSGKKMEWKSPDCGHVWTRVVAMMTYTDKCPFCRDHKPRLLPGFNDLASRYPEIASQAYEWDPTTVTCGSGQQVLFKCNEGHIWKSAIKSRSRDGQGCPECAVHGYKKTKPGYLYLMCHSEWGTAQIGITNRKMERIAQHSSKGWVLLDVVGPLPGDEIYEIEKQLKLWLHSQYCHGLTPGNKKFDGYTESWYEKDLSVASLEELAHLAEVKIPSLSSM